MEEVDKIILDSLRNLDCDIDPEIEHLKQFDADTVTSAVSACLEVILQNGTLPKKLPPSMSARLKLASNLANQIKNLGFRDDMGYQTILYCNEEEVRRVLMFLIERLPRENAKNISIEQVGYIPKIVKTLEEKVKESLSKLWTPSCFLRQGVRENYKGYLVQSMGNSNILRSKSLDIPDFKNKSEDLRYYWIHVIPEVTKQCSNTNLIPSLLFQDSEIPEDFNLKKVIQKPEIPEILSFDALETQVNVPITTETLNSTSVQKTVEEPNNEITSEQNTVQILSQELEEMKNAYITLQEDVKRKESELFELTTVKNEEQNNLKETLAKVKLKTKTATVLSKEENLEKLNNMIQNANGRLTELAKQWQEIQTPLLEEYKLLKNSLTNEECRLQSQKEKIENMKDVEVRLKNDLKEKAIFSQNLLQQYQQINRANNRTMYTRRILEIISNINKQNNDIQKVLKDTRQIQKEIKNLTGQVDRSFTLADELIFYDAKQDEMARRSYKLLAALRDDFNNILKTVQDMGAVERESRNLEEQIKIETSKEIGVKLERVCEDIKQIQKEIQFLKEHSKTSP